MERLKGKQILTYLGKLNFDTSMIAAHGVVPREGLAPGIKVAVADTAYHRASNEWKDHIFLPQKLPENIDELSVWSLEFFFGLFSFVDI
jgi:hypothetical protein